MSWAESRGGTFNEIRAHTKKKPMLTLKFRYINLQKVEWLRMQCYHGHNHGWSELSTLTNMVNIY